MLQRRLARPVLLAFDGHGLRLATSSPLSPLGVDVRGLPLLEIGVLLGWARVRVGQEVRRVSNSVSAQTPRAEFSRKPNAFRCDHAHATTYSIAVVGTPLCRTARCPSLSPSMRMTCAMISPTDPDPPSDWAASSGRQEELVVYLGTVTVTRASSAAFVPIKNGLLPLSLRVSILDGDDLTLPIRVACHLDGTS